MPATSASLFQPYLTEDHQALQRHVEDVVTAAIAPLAPRMEARGSHTDREVRQIVSETGWLGLLIEPEWGGTDAGHVAKTLVLAGISQVSPAAGAVLQASILGAAPIVERGSEEMRRAWLPEIAAGRVWPTIAVTEPETGSHVRGMTATARRKGRSGFVIEGEKDLIGNAALGDFHCVVARTGKPGAPRSLTAFLVEQHMPGVEVIRRPLNGLNGFSCDGLRLNQVHVPASHIIGEIGDGHDIALLSSVVWGRLNLAAVALGIHRSLFEATTRWVSTRPRYAGHLADLEPVRRRVAEMQHRLMTAELAAYHAAYLLDQGQPCDAWLINSKLTAVRAGVRSATDAQQLHGGHAGRIGTPCEQLKRDIDLINAPAGPEDLQLKRLAEQALGPTRPEWSVQHASRRRARRRAPTAAVGPEPAS
ncbi:acyl-CoA dehydrogenase family protein [Streptomyces antimycoticus]|uniref:acyl-CoA dehydrogenase family protein n=1 Tax=Streptomyces antimycoticus TaxID=68175 RepID=UPI00344882AB